MIQQSNITHNITQKIQHKNITQTKTKYVTRKFHMLKIKHKKINKKNTIEKI